MKSGLLVVVVLASCAGEPAKATAPPALLAPPSAPDAGSIFTKALSTRTAPQLELAPHATSPVGRCGVRIEPRPAAEAEKVADEFEARNGRWSRVRADEFSGLVASRFGSSAGREVELDEEAAIAVGLDFVVLNHELFGLDAGDVEASTASASPRGEGVPWQVDIVGERPRPGYEPFEEVHRRWNVRVLLGKAGTAKVVYVTQHSLPPFEMCTEPTITPEAARQAVLGDTPKYSTFDAKIVHDEPVTESSIASVELAIHVARDDHDARILRLAYRIELKNGRWKYFVDADTGEILRVVQLFLT